MFSTNEKSVYEMTDTELIKATQVGSIAMRAKAIEEAENRGLINPNNGKVFTTK